MTTLTQKQMDIADAVDEMEVGQTLWIGDFEIYRESENVYEMGGDRLCFVQVYDRLNA